MTDRNPIDEPAPTIVGPQPGGREGARKINIPRGMERLVALAGMSPGWREKVLSDPLAAALEGGIELSGSERAILSSIPRAAFQRMIGGFARSGMTPGQHVAKVAAGAAAAALLVTGLGYSGESPSAKGGARSDVPPPNPKVGMPAPTGSRPDLPDVAPKVLWMTDLEAAIAQARKTKRAVMAVFGHPNPGAGKKLPPSRPNAGVSAETLKLTAAEKSQKICMTTSKAFRKAVKNSGALAVRVVKPYPPGFMTAARELTPKEQKQIKAYSAKLKTYNAALKKYGIAKTLPSVVFIAPDGSQLGSLKRPTAEKKLIAAISAIPPLLAKWIIAQKKKPEPRPAALGGSRPDFPATKGMRSDMPQKK
jgi:hypothetical protein